MRQKRAKTYRKLMNLYSLSFGFRQPYQVLVDSEICKASVEHKIELLKQLGTVLQGDVKPMITQCCIHELYLQRDQQPAVDLAKTFERRKCNHREAIPGDECLTSVVGESNKHRYVIATQSNPLRSKLRHIPAVPIIHINRSVMILEPPSDATMKAKHLNEEKTINSTSAADQSLLASTSKATESPLKKKRGPKEPNPLSVKKKKKAESLPTKASSYQSKGVSSNKGASSTAVKRKREEDVDDDSPEGQSSSRKRKRKRKGAASKAD